MPLFRIAISKRAKRELKKLAPDVHRQLTDTIDSLRREPRPRRAKPLKGKYDGYWRVRSGDYRIIYQILDQKLIVIVIRAGHRKDIYKG